MIVDVITGVPELRAAITDFHRHYDDVEYQIEDVVVGPGSKLLTDLLVSVFNGGESQTQTGDGVGVCVCG